MQPIIVIGMHRSGSSLLVKVLQQLGVFMGNDFEENNESLFFNKINDWMLFQAGASWDNPENFKYISNDFIALMVDIVRNRLKSTHLKKYLGSSNQSINDSGFIWGWKDPRSTFTFDVWKEIFPAAKIIHIYRNPVDVINSMITRESIKIPAIGNPTRTGIKKKIFGYKLPHERLFYHPFRCIDVNGTFGLWKEYVNKSFNTGSDNNIDTKHISYENLIEEPEDIINGIIEFCNLKVTNFDPTNFLQKIDKTRKYAFVDETKLVEFYKTIKADELVVRLSYGNII